MKVKWNTFGFRVTFFRLLVLLLETQKCISLNQEGLNLLEFRANVKVDPFGTFSNWNFDDAHPCTWLGVHCVDGKVHMLNLSGFALEGMLAPELGKLSHLRSLVLYKNKFFGSIPNEFKELKMLELLDLRHNNLSGTIPEEIPKMVSLKRMLLCGNNFEGSIPPQVQQLDVIDESPSLDQTLSFASHYGGDSSEKSSIRSSNHIKNIVRRRLFEVSMNLPADSPTIIHIQSEEMVSIITTSSGSFPAKMKNYPPLLSQSPASQDRGTQQGWHFYVSMFFCTVLIFAIFMLMFSIRRQFQRASPQNHWKTGLSGQLVKALVTENAGVPKLSRVELETACEDFSNVLGNLAGCTVYKGTLSSGVEIAVASTTVSSHRNWSRRAEMAFRQKIQILSRVNHKNFVNLLGYCSEEKPFMRMMVFEYAPNGTLYEHLHVKEGEHLDWNARVRIIMGITYCLQHMHHDLVPPVAHPNLQSSSILLTDDYAAKVAEIGFWEDIVTKSKILDEEESEHSSQNRNADIVENVYSFGVMLLEIICGKAPYNEKEGSLLNWAAEYWNDKRRLSYMVDPKLKSFKNNELDVICKVIQECINPDPNMRPDIRKITSKLREIIPISPDAATPKLSPVWWAELEILSIEAS